MAFFVVVSLIFSVQLCRPSSHPGLLCGPCSTSPGQGLTVCCFLFLSKFFLSQKLSRAVVSAARGGEGQLWGLALRDGVYERPGSGNSVVGLSDLRDLFQHKLFCHSSLLWTASASIGFPLPGKREGLSYFGGSCLLSTLLRWGCAGEGFKTLFRSLARRKGALVPYCLITLIQVHLQDLSQQICLYFYFSLTATSHQLEW